MGRLWLAQVFVNVEENLCSERIERGLGWELTASIASTHCAANTFPLLGIILSVEWEAALSKALSLSNECRDFSPIKSRHKVASHNAR